MKKRSLTHLEQVDKALTQIRHAAEETQNKLKGLNSLSKKTEDLIFIAKDAINKAIREEENDKSI